MCGERFKWFNIAEFDFKVKSLIVRITIQGEAERGKAREQKIVYIASRLRGNDKGTDDFPS